MLTAFVTSPPSSAAATCSATITPARSCASSVEAARCGVTITLSSSSSGPEYGSLENTSSAAPASFPLPSASTSASSSTSSPRAAFTRRVPSRIWAKTSRLTIPRVSGPSGRCSVRNSASLEHARHRLRALHSELAVTLLRDEGVVRDDAHPEPACAARDLLPDPPEAEHAERLPGELDPAPLRALPATLLERGVCLRDVPRERDEQPDRVLRGGDDRRLGRVRDDDPAARGGLDVDVVDPHACAPDHLQLRAALDQLGGQLRRRANHDRVVVADPLGEVAVRLDVDVEAVPEQLHARVGDRLADEDSQLAQTGAPS